PKPCGAPEFLALPLAPMVDGFSKPLSCADVYICGGCTDVDVSGRAMPLKAPMGCLLFTVDSLTRANESTYARGTAEGAEPK
ncbi:hypothetical protein IMZ48_24055, partial [Candidatus Bathyarchaeota archaeon]|nr:hypothetical protein [Candidatus Bathyarchaeota archaeon]